MAEDGPKPPIPGGLARSDEETQSATARPSGEAQGGVVAEPDDPASPTQARDALQPESRERREAGFGDHKGGTY